MTTRRVPHPMLWLAVLGLLLMVSACGADPNAEAIANDKATMAAMATAIAVEKDEPQATDTPPPTATPLPTDTPTPTSTPTARATPPAKESAGDSLSLPSPTPEPVPEGIILFLSSRDHEPQTEAERQTMGGNRALELYGMRPDGSQQTRLSDGAHNWMKQNNYSLTTFVKPYQVILFGQYVFDLNIKDVDGQLSIELNDSFTGKSIKPAYSPEWSSNNEIVFMSTQRNGSGMAIYFVESSWFNALQLTDPPSGVWGDGFPAWSPDGEWIVFSRDWEGQDTDGLWLVNADGSETRRVFQKNTGQFNARRAFWSPNGNRLVFEGPKQTPDNFRFELWVTDITNEMAEQLTFLPTDVGIWEPRWSPDGRKIAYTVEDVSGQSDRRADIYVINAEGGTPQQLTAKGYYNLAPLWLPLDADEILAGGDTPLQTPPTPTPRPQPQQSQPAKATNCPSPGVEISSPAAGSRFTQRNNFVVGTANIPRFHHWRIEYATDPNGGWSYLLERDYPVDNDKLAMIDASTIPNGPYGLRLTVVDETGNYPEPCEVWFTNGY